MFPRESPPLVTSCKQKAVLSLIRQIALVVCFLDVHPVARRHDARSARCSPDVHQSRDRSCRVGSWAALLVLQ